MVPRADRLTKLGLYSCGILVQARTGCHNVFIEMVMTEYKSQHAAWQKDHGQVMAEIKMLNNTDLTWTLIRLPRNPPMHPQWGDCYDWCMATWGLNNEWVYMGPGTFHFKNKSDAAMFMLKWVQ